MTWNDIKAKYGQYISSEPVDSETYNNVRFHTFYRDHSHADRVLSAISNQIAGTLRPTNEGASSMSGSPRHHVTHETKAGRPLTGAQVKEYLITVVQGGGEILEAFLDSGPFTGPVQGPPPKARRPGPPPNARPPGPPPKARRVRSAMEFIDALSVDARLFSRQRIGPRNSFTNLDELMGRAPIDPTLVSELKDIREQVEELISPRHESGKWWLDNSSQTTNAELSLRTPYPVIMRMFGIVNTCVSDIPDYFVEAAKTHPSETLEYVRGFLIWAAALDEGLTRLYSNLGRKYPDIKEELSYKRKRLLADLSTFCDFASASPFLQEHLSGAFGRWSRKAPQAKAPQKAGCIGETALILAVPVGIIAYLILR